MNVLHSVMRSALVVCCLALSVYAIANSADAQEPAEPVPKDVVTTQLDDPIRVWEPANRITAEDAVNLIWMIGGFCIFGFFLFAILLFIFREEPSRPSKSLPTSLPRPLQKGPLQKESLHIDDEFEG